jgi:RimJ/RimL family protein N-acetyltransferase
MTSCPEKSVLERIAEGVPMTIETARLVMRLHRLDDFDASAAMWADPEVVRHISGVPSTREQSWARLLRYRGHWTLLNYGYWVVEETTTGEFVGEVGFADYHRAMEPSLDGMPELGWALRGQHHGKGYATEAVRAALRWGATFFAPATRIASMITPENVASVRVAEKCGFRLWQGGHYQNSPVLLYARDIADDGSSTIRAGGR